MSDSSDLIPDSALTAVSGAQATISSPSDDLIPPSAIASSGSALQFPLPTPKGLQESDKPLQGMGTAIPQTVSHVLAMPGQALTKFAVKEGVTNPYAAAAIGVLPDLAEDAVGGKQFVKEGLDLMAPPGVSAPIAPHPLAGAVADETSRLADIKTRAQNYGLQVPDSGTAQQFADVARDNQPVADDIIRKNFGLPANAPLTPGMLDSVRSNVAANTYGPIRKIPSVPLSDDAVEGLSTLPTSIQKKLDVNNKVNADNTVSGSDGVDLSQGLRAVSNDYWSAYNRSQLPEHKYLAQQVDNTVDAVEGSIRTQAAKSGNESDVDNWEQGRTAIAQTYNVQAALDSGHVNVSKLRRQAAAGAPLSGDLDMLAQLGEDNPEAFKLSRVNSPQVGFLRRAAAGAAPYAGAAIGGGAGTLMGMPGIGAAGGAILGSHIANMLAP